MIRMVVAQYDQVFQYTGLIRMDSSLCTVESSHLMWKTTSGLLPPVRSSVETSAFFLESELPSIKTIYTGFARLIPVSDSRYS